MSRQLKSAAATALLALFAAGCQPGEKAKTDVAAAPPAAPAPSAAPVAPGAGLASYKTGDLAELDLSQKLELPASQFVDVDGKPHTFAEYKGKVVIMNIWGEWCAPCVEEMPTLAKLQQAFPGGDVTIVPVAFGPEDKRQSAHDKLKKLAGDTLPFFYDTTYNVSYDAKTGNFPSTIFYRDGKEVARLVRPADWASDRAMGLVKAILAGES